MTWLLKLVIASSLLLACAALGGVFVPALAIFTHFICYLLLLSLFALLLSFTPTFSGLSWRPSIWRKLILLTLILQAIAPLSMLLPADKVDLESPQHISLIWMNLHYEQQAVNELDDIVAKTPCDVVAIAEAGAAQLRGKFQQYPHSYEVDEAALVVFSKYPLLNAKKITNRNDRSFLQVDIAVARRRVRLVTAHLVWPIYSAHLTTLENATEVASSFENVIMAGDFNSTPWAAPFRQFVNTAKLQHSRQSYGLQNSWYADKSKIIGLPIDHILYGGNINLTDFEVIETLNSDHNALRGEYDLGGKFLRKARD